jgi:chemotaxis protein methyltransferase CheR
MTSAPPTQAGGGRISMRNFARLSAFIQDYAGIKMPEGKMSMLEGRLRRRVRATGMDDIQSYCAWIFEHGHLNAEAPHLINAVTTNKTDFFRESAHFDFLNQVALPALSKAGVRKIRAWSSACSTGPEAYTMAMVLDDYAGRHAGTSYGILATDIDTDVLATAKRGVYPAEQVLPVPAALSRKYIMHPSDAHRDEVRMAPALRSAIGFARFNLMAPHYPVGEAMHLIFCRNVLIYFDKPTQRAVIARLAEKLTPNGYLFLGHSESIQGLDLPLTQVANTVFQRSKA